LLDKTPATIAAILTVLLLICLAVLFLLLQMIALNDGSERQGLTAMSISLACQSIIIILLGNFAARSTEFLINKVNWSSVIAVVSTVIVMTMIGGSLSFLSSIIAIPMAGIRYRSITI